MRRVGSSEMRVAMTKGIARNTLLGFVTQPNLPFFKSIGREVRGRSVFLLLFFLAACVASPFCAGNVRADEPLLIKDINPGLFDSEPQYLTDVDGTLFFAADDGTNGTELWKSDGTEAGTVMVKDIHSGDSSFPSNLVNVNGTLYFAADDEINGTELWTSDGTESGTVLVKNINPEGYSSNPSELTNVNGTLFFKANDYVTGCELWKSDGTEEGTVRVKDINPGGDPGGYSSNPSELTNVNGVLFFSAYDYDSGVELWKSDGTEIGTVRVKNIHRGSRDSSPANLTNVNGTLFFTAYITRFVYPFDEYDDYELYKSDGTESGTVQVKDIYSGDSSSPSHLTNVNGTLFFAANAKSRGIELWKSDGTEAGTVMVKDINFGGSSSPSSLTNVNGTLFFAADDGTNGIELWKSDGTDSGTSMVKDINSGPGSSSPNNLINGHGWLFFAAGELWMSDGSDLGTFKVGDIYPGPDGSSPDELTLVDKTLFLKANDGSTGLELWGTEITNTPPSVSPIADQDTFINNSIGPIAFTVSDLETASEDLVVTATSNNQTLLPNGNVTLGGTGENRTILLTPATAQTGTAEVMVEVTDGLIHTHTTFFVEWWPALVVGEDSGYATIQEAVGDAHEGDIIVLRDGAYTGSENKNIALEGTKTITITSENGPESTIIDLENSGRAFYLAGNNSTIDGLTIRNGNDYYGAGIYIDSGSVGSPVISNCIFLNNQANNNGGAIYIALTGSARPVISNCAFSENNAKSEAKTVANFAYGGAAVMISAAYLTDGFFEISNCNFSYNASNLGGAILATGGGISNSSSIIRNCSFSHNTGWVGGAVALYDFAPVVSACSFWDNKASWGGALFTTGSHITNSTFWKNTAVGFGGAIGAYEWGFGGSTIVSHCTFSGNTARVFGGAIQTDINLDLANSILWGNSADGGGNQIWYAPLAGQVFNVYHSNIEGGIAGAYNPDNALVTATSTGIIDEDPAFALEEDFHLMPDSPCIDAGTTSPPSGLPSTDKDGNLRNLDGNGDGTALPDMGAYEFDRAEFPEVAASPTEFIFTAGEDGFFAEGQTLSIRSRGLGTLNWTISEDIPWLRVEGADGVSTGETNEARLYVDHTDLNHGIYTGSLNILDSVGATILKTAEITLYVTKKLRVPSSYTTIQDAIDAAIHGDEVIVADRETPYSGTGFLNIDFLGKRITVRSANGPENTVISCGESGRGFIFNSGETSQSVLQGFTIYGGIADNGGGIFVGFISSPKILGCNFKYNAASNEGGGMRIRGHEVFVSHCRFDYNSANQGAGIHNEGSFNTIEECIFTENTATESGGGIYNFGAYVTLNNNTFNDNKADDGAGIYLKDGPFTTVSGSFFENNWADQGSGGGIHISSAAGVPDIKVFNCVFYRNGAWVYGGGVATFNTSIEVNNCTFANDEAGRHNPSQTDLCNTASNGGGIFVQDADLTVKNSIFTYCMFRHSLSCGLAYDPISGTGAVTYDIAYCTIRQDSDGEYPNLPGDAQYSNSYDPLFVDANASNFQLQPESELIDIGTIVPWLFSDIRGSIRPVDGDGDGTPKFDIGAYEYSEYYGGIPGDLPAKAFNGFEIDGGVVLVTDFGYEISWADRDPFPSDPRIDQGETYDVNLALVNTYGLRIELGTYTLDTDQVGYTIPYTFGPEHIGTWRLRLELASDPNQFVLSDEIFIDYKQATRYALSQWIQPPEGADPTVKPDVEEGDACYWSPDTNRLYAIAPTTTMITWYADEHQGTPFPVTAYITYPDKQTYPSDPDTMIHIVDTMVVNLLPTDTPFDQVQKMYADNDATISANVFTASTEGWSVVMYRDLQATEPAEREVFDVVRTYVWNHAKNPSKPDNPILNPSFPILQPSWDIGKKLTDEDHCLECKSGYVFFEDAYYDGYGETKAYDRENRTGPIFAVNQNDPDIIEDDLVVVWYNKSATSTVCWPSKPVHYNTVWPDDRKIVIASKRGSGPLDPGIYGQMANLLIYNQPDANFPGDNPNEEHTAFFTAQGSEHPAVFPLRTDLNRTDWDDTRRPYTSEPYVLLKYKDPLRYEWNFEVYQVVAQSGSYRMQGGQVVPAQAEVERYYLDENGVLIERSGSLPDNSYYIDAEGYLVNPADDVETCYNYSGGNIEPVSCLPVEGVQQHYIDENGQLQVQSGDLPTPSYYLDKYGVLVESDVYYRFYYAGVAGQEINPPYPLNQLTFGPCEESYIHPGDLRWVLKDKDDKFFSRNGGLNGEPATEIVLKYFYRLQTGFWYDLDADGFPDETVGTPVPWLEGLDGTFDGEIPVDTTYAITWPDPVPTLFVGETLTDAKTQDGETVGLPNVKDQCIVRVLFDQPVEEAPAAPNYALHSVNLIDPLKEYSSSDYHLANPELNLPQALKPEKDLSTGRWMFRALPYHLQTRLSYDEVDEVLKFKGVYSSITGEPLLLLNVLSDREIYEIEQVFDDAGSSPDVTFMPHVNELQTLGENDLQYPPANYPVQQYAEMKALTAGDARGTGYVTLAFNNHEDCAAPTTLAVIRVSPELYRGDIKVFESENPFAEKVTLRHNGDFGGNADIRYFEWKYRTADFSGIPLGPANDPPIVWKDYKPQPYDGDPTDIDGSNFYTGAVDTIIQGTGQQLLPDKWFSVRYHYIAPWANATSEWTDPQLYEGWIKRVMKKINLFDQKVKDFHASDVNTIADMIAQAGRRYEGDVALSDEPEYLQNLGIIEVYETLLNRGQSLIGEGDDFADINKALLFAANRLADLYMLEGNEAYADAADPTIGFSTEDGQVGSEASSIFCFENQVDSLLEEELVLLRGRDDEGVRPSYHRLSWNFTLGNGEVAYKENYNITDQATDQDGDGFPDAMDGEINELDAMVMFPQGHGDAWGHYLMAAKKYYSLLKADNFTWIPQSEAILVAGTPIEVDYRDERKFASVAAAKARTGSEIVNLTYRQHYVEDPEGQWQGYKDLDPVRAWGVDGWARRAGQGAFFDWVVGNAILPPDYEGGPPAVERQIAEAGQVEFQLDDIFYQEEVSYLEVFKNGVMQDPVVDYSVVSPDPATNKTVVTFNSGLSEGDEVVSRIYKSVPAVETSTAIQDQTKFEFVNVYYNSGTSYLKVFVNGVEQVFDADYALSSDSVTFHQGLSAGDAVFFKLYDLVEGIQKIDRTTVLELREVASNYDAVQAQVDMADLGLNPLGLAKGSVPFDIDPGAVADGQTHFEQIYNRAVQAMNNAIAVFNHANQSTMLLRRQHDSLSDFQRNIENSEADFNNRLIEVFGYPYPDDCGPGRTYSTDYAQTGPDLYHYMYVDPSELMGVTVPRTHDFPVTFKTVEVDAQGVPQYGDKEVSFHIDTDSRFGLIKPRWWQGRRKAPGEIQMARSDLLQVRGRFEKALIEYDNLLNQIKNQAELIVAQHELNRDELKILNETMGEQQDLNTWIMVSRGMQLSFRTAGRLATHVANAVAEFFPTAVGLSTDAMAPARGAARTVGTVISEIAQIAADAASMVELGHQQAKEIVSAESNIELTALRGGFAIEQQLLQLENLILNEATLRLELYNLIETMQQSAGRYLVALAKGDRLLQDRLRFRRQTAAQIQDYRYTDMAFRIFRNDALQKYRAQFDMAARYVYLAAKAYDYETTLLDHESMAGEAFLTDIVRQRTIGLIENGLPLTGTGLADPMKRMWQNFQVLKPQLGFNNPQEETNRFSLRRELFRVTMDEPSNDTWRQVLEMYRVDDLWDVPEFRRYCRPFAPEGIPQPGIVIPFPTTVTSGLNFFKWPLGGGDSYYSATNFATKVRSVGVWFSNYNSVGLAQTPRIYLVPAGEDVLRTPSYYTKDIRTWQVVDQKMPLPFPIVNSELENNTSWIPTVDTIFDEMFQIRRHSDFRAYHDSGYLNESEMSFDSRLVGRSVWNTHWVLIIPGQALLYDGDEALDTFIHGPEVIGGFGERTGNGISDIKLFFHTYAYSGN